MHVLGSVKSLSTSIWYPTSAHIVYCCTAGHCWNRLFWSMYTMSHTWCRRDSKELYLVNLLVELLQACTITSHLVLCILPNRGSNLWGSIFHVHNTNQTFLLYVIWLPTNMWCWVWHLTYAHFWFGDQCQHIPTGRCVQCGVFIFIYTCMWAGVPHYVLWFCVHILYFACTVDFQTGHNLLLLRMRDNLFVKYPEPRGTTLASTLAMWYIH